MSFTNGFFFQKLKFEGPFPMADTLLHEYHKRLNFYPDGSKPNLQEFIAAHTQPPPTTIRHNPRKSAALPTAELVPWTPDGEYLSQRPKFTLDPAFHAGAYYVQEAGSMFCGYVFDQIFPSKSNLKVLDLCAAPGGKSTHLVALLDPEHSVLLSNEVIQTRAAVLVENAAKWGYMNHWVSAVDPQRLGQTDEIWDCIVVDAPCSGSGLWRKDEQAMQEWSEQHVKMCAERQKRIVADIVPTLAPGGFLLYSTCSFSKEENEEQIDWMVANLGLESVELEIPNHWGILQTKSAQGNAGFRSEPWHTSGEGFFLAILKKPSQQPYSFSAPEINRKKSKLTQKTETLLQDWLDIPAFFIEKNEEYYAVPQALAAFWLYLESSKIKLRKTGTALGKIIQSQLIPNEELALSVHLRSQYPSIDVDKETALNFLRKNEIKSDKELQGWHLVRYNELGLGWSKWMKNRMNNYYPKNWRIRML